MTTVAVVGSTWPVYLPGLYSQADTRLFITNPVLAAGDFQRSINGGAWTNLDNLPTVTPALSTQVYILLSAAETTAAGAGGQINVRWVDALGGQWCSGGMLIFVHAAEVDASCTLAATQGAVAFTGQVSIAANVAGQGALRVVNANATGHGIEGNGGNAGLYGIGGTYGQLLAGGTDGLRTAGTVGYGVQATGGIAPLAPNTLDAQAIAANAITAAKIAANAITAAKFATDAIDANALAASALLEIVAAIVADPWFAGITSLADWLGALAGLGVDAATLAEIQATLAGATYDNTTDSLEAIAGWLALSGAISYTYTVLDSGTGLPIEGVEVVFTTDLAGLNKVCCLTTDTFGVARTVGGSLPRLDAGSYFVWRQRAGYAFINPVVVIVS